MQICLIQWGLRIFRQFPQTAVLSALLASTCLFFERGWRCSLRSLPSATNLPYWSFAGARPGAQPGEWVRPVPRLHRPSRCRTTRLFSAQTSVTLRVPTFQTPSEPEYLEALESRERLMTRLAIFEGLRPGEILALRWGSVEGEVMKIRERVTRVISTRRRAEDRENPHCPTELYRHCRYAVTLLSLWNQMPSCSLRKICRRRCLGGICGLDAFCPAWKKSVLAGHISGPPENKCDSLTKGWGGRQSLG